MTDRLDFDAADDKTMPAIVYGLYLLGFPTGGFTVLVGLIVAYVTRKSAGPATESHYTFLIRTFWLSIAWLLIGVMLLFFGIPLSFILVGIPIALLGVAILTVVSVWFAVRCILGAIFLARGQAYPRPYSWLA
jgi:uncharacterized membrane protein